MRSDSGRPVGDRGHHSLSIVAQRVHSYNENCSLSPTHGGQR